MVDLHNSRVPKWTKEKIMFGWVHKILFALMFIERQCFWLMPSQYQQVMLPISSSSYYNPIVYDWSYVNSWVPPWIQKKKKSNKNKKKLLLCSMFIERHGFWLEISQYQWLMLPISKSRHYNPLVYGWSSINSCVS